MMPSTCAIAIAALLAASLPAEAHFVRMRGEPTCAAWTSQRPANAGAHEAWLLGFVSGVAQEMDKNVPDEATHEAIFHWMDDYCARNPNHSVGRGGYFYVGKLRGEKKFK